MTPHSAGEPRSASGRTVTPRAAFWCALSIWVLTLCPVTGKSARSGALTCAGLFKWQESDRCRAIEVGPPCAGVGSCQLFRPGGVGRVEPGCGEGDGVGVDRCVRVGVVAGRGAVAVVGGLQCEEPVSPVERNDCW